MSDIKSLQPPLRFTGFERDWEKQFLANNAIFSKGKGYSKGDLRDSGYPIILYGRLYTNYQTVITEVNTYVIKNNVEAIKSKGNEVIVPSSGETAEDIARASAVLQENVILGGDLNIILPNNNLIANFLALTLSYGNIQKELSKKAQGKSVVHIRNSDLKELKILITDTKEQISIGNFFQNIDKQLTLHQAKHRKLQQLKKAMLDKMFPKAGAKVPEIRFAGFTGNWVIKTLGNDIATITGGGTPNTLDNRYWNGDIDWFSPTEIGSSPFAQHSNKKITQLGLNSCSAKKLPAHRSILFSSRAGIGHMAILKREATTNQGFQSLVLKDGYNTYFVYSMGHLITEYALRNASGSTFLEISGKLLGEMEICIPSLVEQEKIGSYFQNLDRLISLQQQQIDKLKNIKQACLKQMFV